MTQVKIFKKISNVFFKIIDTIVVMPLTRLIYKITGKKDKNGKFFETLFTKPTALLFISLALSILIFIAVDQQIIRFSDSSAEVFKGQSVNVVYNEEAYVVEGLPETVDVTLIGRKMDVYLAKQYPFDGVTLDLMDVYEDLDNDIIRHDYTVACVGFDPYNAKAFIERWATENSPYGIEKIIQGAKTESVPLGELKQLAESRLLIFDEGLMSYTMGNSIVIVDTNGNRKLLKRKHEQKIDNVSALMDAYAAYKLHKENFL